MGNHVWTYGHSMDYHGITSSFLCQPIWKDFKQNSALIFAVRHKRKQLTNRLPCIIMNRHLRECWNGRQARLRCVWLRRVGSSPISRTRKDRIPVGYPVFSGMGGGTRKAVKKTCRWHVFRPWESLRKSNGGPQGPAGDFRNSVQSSRLHLPSHRLGEIPYGICEIC